MLVTSLLQEIVKVGLSTPEKTCVICLIESPLEMMKNAFYFILKALFCPQDILVFVTTFWSSRKNGLIKKIRLTSKLMTSPPGLQAIAIHILPNISQRNGNQTLRYGQLIGYDKRNISLQKLCGK